MMDPHSSWIRSLPWLVELIILRVARLGRWWVEVVMAFSECGTKRSRGQSEGTDFYRKVLVEGEDVKDLVLGSAESRSYQTDV